MMSGQLEGRQLQVVESTYSTRRRAPIVWTDTSSSIGGPSMKHMAVIMTSSMMLASAIMYVSYLLQHP